MGKNNRNLEYTIADFQRYRDGLMTSMEEHAFEKKCLEDPFLAEAFEGYDLLIKKGVDADRSYSSLQEKLDERVREKPGKNLAIWYYACAAALLIAVGIGLINYLNKEIALKPTQTSLDAKDSASLPDKSSEHLTAETHQMKSKQNFVKTKKEEKKTNLPEPKPDSVLLAAKELPDNETLAEGIAALEIHAQRSVPAPASFQRSGNKMANPIRSDLTVTGRVIHNENALSGANIANAGYAAVSDNKGKFALPGKPGDSLILSMPGYEPQKIHITKFDLGTIQLLPDTQALSEVIVLGHSVQSKNSPPQGSISNVNITKAQPKNGWNSYSEYLRSSTEIWSEQGMVTVSFLVSETGVLSQFEAKGATGLFEAAIQIVKNGPAWLPASNNDVMYADKVKIDVLFMKK